MVFPILEFQRLNNDLAASTSLSHMSTQMRAPAVAHLDDDYFLDVVGNLFIQNNFWVTPLFTLRISRFVS
jgi:hypothetical protein